MDTTTGLLTDQVKLQKETKGHPYLWCIGGGLMQLPLLKEAELIGLKTIVSDASESCPAKEFADLFVCLSIFDVEGHVQAGRSLSKDLNIVGVLAAGIDAPVTMSRLGESLGLPCVSSSISEIVHNKSTFRDFCRSNNIPTPLSREFNIANIDDLSLYLDSHPLPFIIKNVDSSGSRGTRIFHNRDPLLELQTAKEAAKCSKTNSFLVESVWTGQECTVETIFDIEGNFHPCFITDRQFDYSSGVPLELGLVSPSFLDPEIQEECYILAERVSRLLGINIGASKFDMIITSEGPKIIEMTTRLSGGFDCQYLVPSASGKNILKAAILTSIGQKFDYSLLIDKKKNVAVSGSHWPTSGTITSIEGITSARQVPGVEHIIFRKREGDSIKHYQSCADRVSFIIASGHDLVSAQKSLASALSKISISVR